jgi:hypothetical protein
LNTPGSVSIAAIDNGLAFPFKHPDNWRAYPFHWSWLPQAKVPFSEEITSLIFPLVSNMNFVEQELCEPVRQLFLLDKHADRTRIEGQLSVIRGQVSVNDNRESFENRSSPGPQLDASTSRWQITVRFGSNAEHSD